MNMLYSPGNLTNALWRPEWKEVEKGGDICIFMEDSFCCIVIIEAKKYCKATVLQ